MNTIRKLINLPFYILVVYINLGYLIPKFLSQKNFMTYCLLLLAMVAVFTPIKVLLLYITYDEVDPRAIPENLYLSRGLYPRLCPNTNTTKITPTIR